MRSLAPFTLVAAPPLAFGQLPTEATPELPGQDQPYDLFFEAVFIDPLTLDYPLADSNAPRVTVN
ncbi:MAG: hypothetical protein AAFZ65_07940 [Planctomycetota bacterium]